MEEEARVEISLENRFKEALRKAKEVREDIRNYEGEPSTAECLAYDMQYIEEYVKQLKEENKRLDTQRIIGNIYGIKIEDLEPVLKPYYIPKSKIKEKIEEIKLRLKDDCIALHEFQRLAKIEVLQELLEEE